MTPMRDSRATPVRPKAVAFDIIGTVFSLAPLHDALAGLGLPAASVAFLYTATLRDTFALAATDGFAPFRVVMEGCLDEVLARAGLTASPREKAAVLGRMAALPPHDDAGAAFAVLAAAGIRVFALSNGAADTTRGLFDTAGLSDRIEAVLSVEQVGLSKPRPEVYRFAAETAGVAPGEMALVATHPWDIHGAKTAGLVGAYVARGLPFSPVLRPPDVTGETLLEAAQGLVDLPGA
jgi:2-haloacid dehalogenase